MKYQHDKPKKDTANGNICDYCRRDLPYKEIIGRAWGDRIIGRSKAGGYICRQCYELPVENERDYRNVAIARLPVVGKSV